MKILLIEDNQEYGQRIKLKLQSYGHAVDLSPTFADAQNLLQTRSFDMVIVELATPEESIINFLSYLKMSNKETPVYALRADYAVTTSFKDLNFDMVGVLSNNNPTQSRSMPQKESTITPKVIQPKTFHNFCLN